MVTRRAIAVDVSCLGYAPRLKCLSAAEAVCCKCHLWLQAQVYSAPRIEAQAEEAAKRTWHADVPRATPHLRHQHPPARCYLKITAAAAALLDFSNTLASVLSITQIRPHFCCVGGVAIAVLHRILSGRASLHSRFKHTSCSNLVLPLESSAWSQAF